MMNKKFELTNESKIFLGVKLYRIKALKDFGIIFKGELGGFIEKEDNLSQYGNAWVFDDACVYGNACVYGDARVFDDACVYGNACVYGDARVFGDACVYGNARVFGDACVYGNARVFGDAYVSGNARVFGEIKLEFGWCFGRKIKDWDITELENEEEILLIKDYQPATEENEKNRTNITRNSRQVQYRHRQITN